MRNAILVLGSEGVSKAQFASRITGQVVGAETQVVEWRIDTKYFQCGLRVWLDTLDNEDNEDKEMDAAVAALGSAVDALVLLFDSAQNHSFHQLSHCTAFLNNAKPSIALCVDVAALEENPEPLSQAAELLLDEAALWCAENGLELVCHEEGEDPVNRVIQAIHANEWDGLVMKDSASKQNPRMNLTGSEDSITTHPDKDWKAMAAAEFGENEGDYLDLKGVLAREDGSFAELLAGMNMNDLDDDKEFGDFMAGLDSASAANTKGFDFGRNTGQNIDFDIPEFDEFDPSDAPKDVKNLRASLFGELDDDDFFEKAISQIKTLRDTGAGLGDEKRREMAKKLALSLLLEDE